MDEAFFLSIGLAVLGTVVSQNPLALFVVAIIAFVVVLCSFQDRN